MTSSVAAWRWATGERPLEANSAGHVLSFRRENAPHHYATEFTPRQAELRQRVEALYHEYPDLDPDMIADAAWRALDRVIEDCRIVQT